MRALLCLALAACGPNLSRLVADHHDREAVCAAVDGSARDRARIGEALERDAGYVVHVQLVDREVLAGLAGEAPAGFDLVRIELRSNAIPVDHLAAHASLVDARGTALAVPADWDALARLTGEQLPAAHRETTYLTAGNVARAGAAWLTLGVSLLFTHFQTGTAVIGPSDEEYAATAPHARALYHALAGDCTTNTPGEPGESVRCTWFALVGPRAATDRVQLAVDQRYVANRVVPREHFSDDERCVLDRVTRIDLGPLAQLAARFGNTMRPLDGIQASPITSLEPGSSSNTVIGLEPGSSSNTVIGLEPGSSSK